MHTWFAYGITTAKHDTYGQNMTRMGDVYHPNGSVTTETDDEPLNLAAPYCQTNPYIIHYKLFM